MIKGKTIGAAVLCAVLLTGCAKKAPDLPKIYEKNLQYTFGSYSVNVFHKYDNGDKDWRIHFTDKNGTPQIGYLRSNVYEESEQKMYGSKEKMQKAKLFDLYENCMSEIGSTEIWDDILSKHYDMKYNSFTTEQINDEVTIHTNIGSAVSIITSDRAAEMLEGEMSPENGIKLSEMDLRSLAAKDYMMTVILVSVHDGADPEAYVEKTKAALEEFEKYDPVNYAFEVIDKDKKICFGKYIVFGEEKKHTDFFSESTPLFNITVPIAEAWE